MNLSTPRILAITGLVLLSLGAVGLWLHDSKSGYVDPLAFAVSSGLFMLCAVMLANGPRTRS